MKQTDVFKPNDNNNLYAHNSCVIWYFTTIGVNFAQFCVDRLWPPKSVFNLLLHKYVNRIHERDADTIIELHSMKKWKNVLCCV